MSLLLSIRRVSFIWAVLEYCTYYVALTDVGVKFNITTDILINYPRKDIHLSNQLCNKGWELFVNWV